VGAVLACGEHARTLAVTLEPLLEVANLREVLVIDWSGSASSHNGDENENDHLSNLVLHNQQHQSIVRYIRLAQDRVSLGEHESTPPQSNQRRVPTAAEAMNLGASLLHDDTIIFLDCDVAVSPDFVSTHPLRSHDSEPPPSSSAAAAVEVAMAYSGWWYHAVERGVRSQRSDHEGDFDDAGAVHEELLSTGKEDDAFDEMDAEEAESLRPSGDGIAQEWNVDSSVLMVLKRASFWEIGGYDERLRTRAHAQLDFELRLKRHLAAKGQNVLGEVANATAFRVSLPDEAPLLLDEQSEEEKVGSNGNNDKNSDDVVSTKDLLFRGGAGLKLLRDFRAQLEKACIRRLSDGSREDWRHVLHKRPSYSVTKVDDAYFIAERFFSQPESHSSATSHWIHHSHAVSAPAEEVSAALHELFRVPLALLTRIDEAQQRALVGRLSQRRAQLIVHHNSSEIPRILVAHVMHGFGNRMRALGSAMSIARATNRELVVIWQRDHHMGADMRDLFELQSEFHGSQVPFVVADGIDVSWSALESLHRDGFVDGRGDGELEEMFRDGTWKEFELYDYMELDGGSAKKGRRMELDREEIRTRSIYFKSAYIAATAREEWSSWVLDNSHIAALTARREVSVLVNAVEEQVKNAVVGGHRGRGLEQAVGVHVRSRSLDEDIEDVEKAKEYSVEAQREMEAWRQRSNARVFIEEMQRILKEEQLQLQQQHGHSSSGTVFFVAADSEHALREIQNEMPRGSVVFIPRTCDSRARECVQYAFADVLCLARTRLLLGSNWSSFTELAQRLAAKHRPSRLAGVDFGK